MFDRRSLIKSAAGSMAGAFLAPAFASSVLSSCLLILATDEAAGPNPSSRSFKSKIAALVKVRRK